MRWEGGGGHAGMQSSGGQRKERLPPGPRGSPGTTADSSDRCRSWATSEEGPRRTRRVLRSPWLVNPPCSQAGGGGVALC